MDTEHRRVQKQTNALYVGYRHGTCIRETNKQGSEGCCCIMSYQRGGLRRHAASQSQVKSSSYSPHPHKIIPPVFDRHSGCFQCSLCKLVQRTPPSLGFPLPKQPWAEARMMVPLVNVYGLSVVWYDNRLFMSDVAGITIESGKRWMHEEYRVC